jgi:hypothetical protein
MSYDRLESKENGLIFLLHFSFPWFAPRFENKCCEESSREPKMRAVSKILE